MRAIPIIAVAAAAAAIASCLPTELCACTPLEPSLVVDVTVEAPDGAPVLGADVEMDYFAPTCEDEHRYAVLRATTGPDGHTMVVVGTVPPPACFLVRAIGPDGSGLGTAQTALQHTADDPLPFGDDAEIHRVDLTLRLPAVP